MDNKKWKAEEKRIKQDAMVLRGRSNILREKSVALCAEIDAFADKYPDNVLNDLPWDEKELVMGMADEFERRWIETRQLLKILDAEFRVLIKRTNDLYGKKVIQEPEPLDTNLPENFQDEWNDRKDEWSKSGDWWKSDQ